MPSLLRAWVQSLIPQAMWCDQKTKTKKKGKRKNQQLTFKSTKQDEKKMKKKVSKLKKTTDCDFKNKRIILWTLCLQIWKIKWNE